jgi:pyrroloquinoline quinone (PQQ) biosynthesis protein C
MTLLAALTADFHAARARFTAARRDEANIALTAVGSRDAGHTEVWARWQEAEANHRHAVAAYHANIIETAGAIGDLDLTD